MLSFTERMAEGRDNAQERRNRGLPTGKDAAGWNYKRSQDDDIGSWDWLCREARSHWRSAKSEARNDFAAACLNGPGWRDDAASLADWCPRGEYN